MNERVRVRLRLGVEQLRRVGNALSGWHRKRYAGAPAHEALLPVIWAGRFNQGRPGSSSGSHREGPQAGEPGLIARQAPGSLSIWVQSQFPVDSTFDVERSAHQSG